MKKIENSRVLVTGGAGFIGSNLCETLLEQNNKVICLDNFSTGTRENIASFLHNKNFTLMEGDIRQMDDCKKALDGVEHVLHQAALGSISRSVDDPVTTNAVNISGFLNMLQACKETGIKRLVYASSSSTYGDLSDLPKTEERIGKPLSPYAVTKYVNELYAKVFSDLYGIETIGLRYFNVFGKRQRPDGAYAAAIPKFINCFLSGQSPVIYGDGNQSRDFTYIENVVQVNQLAAMTENREAVNEVYNVAFGENNSINEVIEIIKKLLVEINPEAKNIQTRYSPERPGEVKHSHASVEKARKLLGYEPLYNLKQGLEQIIGK